jgi:hypothetical protein
MFGKEYGTPATRLLFERTLRRPGGLVGTLTNTFLQKNSDGHRCTSRTSRVESPGSQASLTLGNFFCPSYLEYGNEYQTGSLLSYRFRGFKSRHCGMARREPALKDSVAIIRIDDHSGISTLCL